MALFRKKASKAAPSGIPRATRALGRLVWSDCIPEPYLSDQLLALRAAGDTDGLRLTIFGWDRFQQIALAMNSDPDRAFNDISEYLVGTNDAECLYCAYELCAEAVGYSANPQYLALLDVALDVLSRRGVARHHLRGFESSRWEATHERPYPH